MGNLTRQDAAKFLSISLRKLDELRMSGELPHIRIGRSVRFTMEDLHAFNMRNKRKGDRRVRS
jgi:excisionase family DNA binding protein